MMNQLKRKAISRQQAEKLFEINQPLASEYHCTQSEIQVTIRIADQQDLLVVFDRSTHEQQFFIAHRHSS